MGTELGLVGTVRKTADGELLSGGERIRVYAMHLVSGAGGNSVVSLKNGGAAGDIWITCTGTASTGITFDFGHKGFVFTNGCYVDVDANTNSVLVSCWKEPK
jgi:hypothetical protein